MSYSHSPEEEKKILRRSVLLVTTFAAFLTPFLGSAINLALPAMARDLNASAIGLGWVASSFTLSSAIFLLPFGRLGDIIGRKKIFTAGIILYTLSTALVIFAHTLTYLIILRVVMGFAGAMIFGTSMAILTSVYEPGERGRAMGINITATYTGLSIGPIVGGILTESFGWRSIFIFLIPFGLIALYFLFTRIKTEWAEAKGDSFDWKGAVIYGVSLASFMYGFSKLPSVQGWSFLGGGLILGLVFLLFEKRAENPVFDIGLFRHNRVFAFSGLAALIHYSATSATGFFISLYLQYIHALDARSAGMIMISQPVAMALLSPVAGRLSDKRNPGIIASVGMGLTAAGLISLCFITGNTSHVAIIVLLAVMGVGFGLFSSPNSNAIMSSVEKKHLGVASGVVGTMRMVGQMMSMGIALMILALFVGTKTITPDTYPGLLSGMRTGFVIFSVLCVLGIFASLARNSVKRNN
ncbi:MAG: MFS transporter [Bacteroidales bacterium]